MNKKSKKTKGDVLHSITKTGLAMMPVIGGPASELFSQLITPPVEKRRNNFINRLDHRLKDLEISVQELEELFKKEHFITAILTASQVAMRTHEEEKLDALCNAVLNTIAPNAPEEDLQLILLNLIDNLTGWHLRILKFFENPGVWLKINNVRLPQVHNGTPSDLLKLAYPELSDRREFYDHVIKDLFNRGLMTTDEVHARMTIAGMTERRITDIGVQLIEFITSPLNRS